MAGSSWVTSTEGGAARDHHIPNRDRLGVTTLKCAAARGPCSPSGLGPPHSHRPLPSAADHRAPCFSRHRRIENPRPFASNFGSLLLYAATGAVVWPLGAAMAGASLLGA